MSQEAFHPRSWTPSDLLIHAKRYFAEAFNDENVAVVPLDKQGIRFKAMHTDGRLYVVRFSNIALNMDRFREARKKLGDVAPNCLTVEKDLDVRDQELHAYLLSYSNPHGWCWQEAVNTLSLSTVASLGQIIAGLVLRQSSQAVWNQEILPKLQTLLQSQDETVLPFKETIRLLLAKAPERVCKLPLCLTYDEFDCADVIVSGAGRVIGLGGWGNTVPPRPFGMYLNQF